MSCTLGDYWEDQSDEAQRRGAPTHVPAPYVIRVYPDESGFAQLQIGPGVVALELDRASSCGPVSVNGQKTLYPGETFELGRADASLEIDTVHSRLPRGLGLGPPERQTTGPGLLVPEAVIVCHRDRRTLPPGAARSSEDTARSMEPFEFAAAAVGTEREVVQIVADVYRSAVIVAWSRTGAFDAFAELVWAPKTTTPNVFVRREPQAVVNVPATQNRVIFDGDTRGASIVRLVATQITGADTRLYGEIRLTAGSR